MDEWVDVRNTTPLLIPYVDERTGEIVEIREEVVPVTRNQLPSPVLFLPEDAIVLAVVERRVKAGQVFLICLGRHVRDPQRRAKRVFAFADQPFILSIQAPGDASKSTTQLGRLEGTLRTWYRKHLLGQRVRGYEAVGRKRMNTDDDYIRARKLALSDIETAIRAYYDQTEQTQGRKWDLLQVWMNKYLPRPVSRYTIRLRLTQLMRKGKVPLG